MQKHAFSKWNASGNTTLFLEEELPAATVCRALQPDALNCEQAGYVYPDSLRMCMAGGEFCVNATRTFGAWLAGKSGACRADYEVTVSGWPGPVQLHVDKQEEGVWQVQAGLELTGCAFEDCAAGPIVHLPGISHLLCAAGRDCAPHTEEARRLMEHCGLENRDACGVVWYEERWHEKGRACWAMTPFVYVRALDTLYAEGACGSGALALALALQRRGETCTHFELVQPSGGTLTVGLAEAGRAVVSGEVRLVCEGVWYA